MIEQILTSIGSELLVGLGSFIIGGLGVWLWVKTGLSKAVKTGGKPAGNFIGLFMWNNAIKHIKDNNLRNKMIEDLDLAGDDFDEGFDQGIRGKKL